MASRFLAFNPEEREILRVLLESHANTVSQIACAALGVRVADYLILIERLERECNEHE